MMKGMNPKDDGGEGAVGGAFSSFSSGISDFGSRAFGGMGQTWASMSVLDSATKVRMNPLQLRKAGAVIQNMQGADYSDEQINDVCRALFLDQTEEDMQKAWKVFDLAGEEKIAADDFKKALPLMGEDVPPEKIDELFKLADADGSGRIEFSEFVTMMKGMNPKDASEGGMFNSFSDMKMPEMKMPEMGVPNPFGGEANPEGNAEEAAAPAAEE